MVARKKNVSRMEQHPVKTKHKFQLPAQFAPIGFLWKELTRDTRAFHVLIACTLAMVTTGLEPAFLTLSTSEIQNELRTPESHAPMFIAVGFLALAVLTLVTGTSGDLFGRKRVMVIGLTGLTLANLFGALTLGTPLFVITDVLAAISVIAVMPMCVAIITLTFPLAVRPLAYAMLFGSLGTAIILGASIGGIFDALGLPSVAFLPVVIVGVFALRHVARYVPESRAPREFRHASAVVNLVLLVGVFILVYLVIVAPSLLSSWLPALLALGVLLIIAACVRWLRQRVPFFSSVEMFTGRDVGFSILAGVVLFMGQGAFFYQFTTFFQDVQNMTVVQAGLAFLPFVVGLLAGSFLVARLALRYGARRIIAGGFVVMGISMVWMSFVQVETSYWFLLVPITLIGFGFGLATPARTQVVLSAPPPELAGSAAAINTAAGQSGYALGVVLSSILVTQLADLAFLKPLAQAGVPEEVLTQIKAALPSIFSRTASSQYPNLPQAVLDMASARYDQAFATGMEQMFLACAVLMFLAAGAIYLGMHRGLRAAARPPLISPSEPKPTQP
jgi:MFS transporter, DHA2 family, multidrug resistance protein